MEENYKDMLTTTNTDMELDVMKRIASTLPRGDIWRLYRDRAFRKKAIADHWANVHGVGDT
jgi:hypothetical protein